METLRQDRPRFAQLFGGNAIGHGIMVIMAFVFLFFAASAASAETRKLKLYFLHTGERAEITFKKNGKYVQGGLKKINRFLRDWRRNEPTKMDPRLLDLIWEVYKETKSKKAIHVISAYRSPATNSLLRKRGRGVAKKSQHTMGKALDFFIPGVSLRKLRNIGLRKGLGGVGYYPKSGSPFVHMDTGRVRHWPRMSRKELVRVFPKGNTLHVPTDGKPLARYNQAKAAYERKVKGQGKIVVAKAEDIEKKPGLFAKLLGRGEDEDGQIGSVAAPKPVAVKAAPAPAPQPAEVKTPVPAATVAAPEPEVKEEAPIQATPEIILASLPSSVVPVPVVAPRAIAVAAVEEPVEIPDENTEPSLADELAQPADDGEAIEVASIVPLPAPRAELVVEEEPSVEGSEVVEIAPEPEVPAATPEIKVAALSPVEIEDLRKQVYSVLDSNQGNSIIEEPSEVTSNVIVAAVNASESGNTLSLLPQPNPRKLAVSEIEKRIAVQTGLEPGTASTGEPAVPQTRPAVEIASLEPIEPGTRTSDTAPTPLPNPSRPALALAPEPAPELEVAEGIPVPSRAARQVAAVTSPAPATAVKEESSSASTLTVLAGNAASKQLLGKWALAADTTIAKISEIRPPAYAKNVIRERPTAVLAQGFVSNGGNLLTTRFSGSSLEFLDFRRF